MANKRSSKRAAKRPSQGSQPTFGYEREELSRHGGPVVGVDEAGRGPLAGPVVAAAVAFSGDDIATGLAADLIALNDSKAVGESERERMHDLITARYPVGIGVIEVVDIDRINILNATMAAMQTAVGRLPAMPAAVLVDGNRLPTFRCHARAVVGGDARCISIAAASVVAKVHRDRIMVALDELYPQYGFERHKGYGTKAHLEAIAKYGVIDQHRRSFRPVRVALGEECD